MNETKLNSLGCERCTHLCQEFSIRVPADLDRAIRIAADNLADGIIVEVPSATPVSSEPFSAAGCPWADVIGYGFRCTSCGQLFSLSAETYHGAGGEWRPVARL